MLALFHGRGVLGRGIATRQDIALNKAGACFSTLNNIFKHPP
jgi:hypothetical protein